MEILSNNILILLSWVFVVVSTSHRGPVDKSLEKVLQCASMSSERKNSTKFLVDDLQRVMQTRWPGSKVTQFGSLVVDIAVKDSDVDCFVRLPPSLEPTNQTVVEAAQLLGKYPHLFHSIETVFAWFTSMVHFTHTPTGHKGDLNFKAPKERIQTYVLKYILQSDVRARQLAVLIKYWARLHKPAQAKQIMANYGIVNLVIFYLQQIKVLSPIYTLRKDNKIWDLTEIDNSDNFNGVFSETHYHTSNNDTILEMLSGFFKFYANFDFENKIVSTFSGTAIDRKLFQRLETVPDIFDIYKSKVQEDIRDSLDLTTPVCIQNFLRQGENIGSTTTKEELDHFRSNLKYAAETIKNKGDSPLQYIFNDTECFRNSE